MWRSATVGEGSNGYGRGYATAIRPCCKPRGTPGYGASMFNFVTHAERTGVAAMLRRVRSRSRTLMSRTATRAGSLRKALGSDRPDRAGLAPVVPFSRAREGSEGSRATSGGALLLALQARAQPFSSTDEARHD